MGWFQKRALIPCPSYPLTVVVKDQHPEPGGLSPRTPSCQSPHTLLLQTLDLDLWKSVNFHPRTQDLSCVVLPRSRPRDRGPWTRDLSRKWFQEKPVTGWRDRMGQGKEPSWNDISGSFSFNSIPPGSSEFVLMQGKRAGLSHSCTSHTLALLACGIS